MLQKMLRRIDEDPTNWPQSFCLLLTMNINPYVEIKETWIRYELKRKDMKIV